MMFLLRTNLTVARNGDVVIQEKPISAENTDLMIPAGRKAGRQPYCSLSRYYYYHQVPTTPYTVRDLLGLSVVTTRS